MSGSGRACGADPPACRPVPVPPGRPHHRGAGGERVRLLLQGQGLHALPAAGEPPGPRLSVPVNPPVARAAREAGAALAWGPMCGSFPAASRFRPSGGGRWGGDRAAAAPDVGTLSSTDRLCRLGGVSGRGAPAVLVLFPGVRPPPQPPALRKQPGRECKAGGPTCLAHLGRAQWGGPCSRCRPGPPCPSHLARF